MFAANKFEYGYNPDAGGRPWASVELKKQKTIEGEQISKLLTEIPHNYNQSATNKVLDTKQNFSIIPMQKH